jgi:DNA polymerase
MMLADIYEAYREDPKFAHLRTEGIILVPGEGRTPTKVMIVGEAPGAMENTHGRPFVGASGQVLRSLIRDVAGIPLENVFITNTVKYRPPGNRTPSADEAIASIPYLRKEYKAIGNPPVVVALGAVPKTVLAPALHGGVLANAGKMFPMNGSKTRLWLMTHPAYALRNKEYRVVAEEHWARFGSWMREEYPDAVGP